jgi:hypothetical protein
MIINHLKNNTIMKKKYSKPETYYEGMEIPLIDESEL